MHIPSAFARSPAGPIPPHPAFFRRPARRARLLLSAALVGCLAGPNARAVNLIAFSNTNIGADGTYDLIAVGQGASLGQAGFSLVTGDLRLSFSSGMGAYNMSGGSLTVNSVATVGFGDGAGAGFFNQSGNSTCTFNLLRVGSGANGTYVMDGGTLNAGNVEMGSATSGAGSFTLTGGAHNVSNRLILGTSGGTAVPVYNLNGGTLTVGAGGINAAGSTKGILNFNGGNLRASADSTTFISNLAAANVTGGVVLDTTNRIVTVSQPLLHAGGGTDGGLVKLGSGHLILTAANTYTGGTDVREGRLVLSGAGRPGAPGSGLSVQGGASLDLSGVSIAPGYFTAGHNSTILNSSGAASTLTVGTNNAAGTFQNGPMSGNISLTKIGTGDHSLAAAHTYTGPTLVSAGTLYLTTSLSTNPVLSASASITVASGATLALQGTNPNALNPAIPLTVAGTLQGVFRSHTLRNLTLNGGSVTGAAPDATYGNFVFDALALTSTGTSSISAPAIQLLNDAVNGPPTFTVASGTLTVSSPLTDTNFNGSTYLSPGGLTKAGPGTLVLTGANTYSGTTTVNAGTLTYGGLDNVAPTGGPVIVQNSGTQVNFGRSSIWGVHTSAPASALTLQAGTLAANTGTFFNVLNNLTLNGAELRATGGFNAALPAYSLKGTVTVGGSAASSITATGTVNGFTAVQLGNNVAGGQTVFDVADATGNPAADLTIAPALQNSRNADATAGVASGLIKRGPGTLQLNGVNAYTGATTVEAGTLTLASDASLAAASAVTVQAPGALANFGVIGGPVSVAGLLTGTGTLNGGLTVQSGGLVQQAAVGTLTLNGAVTNHGTMRFSNGAVLLAGGATSFANHGILDLISAGAATTLPTLTGNGLVLTAGSVRAKAATRAGATVTITIDSHDGHLYALQRSVDLAAGFQPVPGVLSQNGATGITLTFIDPNAPLSGNVFYRVAVD